MVPVLLILLALPLGILPLFASAAGGDGVRTHQTHLDSQFTLAAVGGPEILLRPGWTVTTDSQETVGEDGRAANVIDGNSGTIWHTQWAGAEPPYPHWLVIDTKASYAISGLVYLPRPPVFANGRIGRYEIHVSPDGTNWGAPVATGTFPDTAAEKAVTFAPATGRYVRLRALSEAGGRGPWSSAAEINLIGEAPPPTAPAIRSRTGWTVTADSQETAGEDGRTVNVLDGNLATIWHTQWTGTQAPLPHWLIIDTKAAGPISGLVYAPRPTTFANGRIGRYEIHVSADGTSWGSPVATGTFPDSAEDQTVRFAETTRRYIRLTALSEAGNRGPWTSAAEINLLGGAAPPPPPPPNPSQTGKWSATIGFPLVPGAAALLPGNRVLTWSAYTTHAFGGSGKTVTPTLNSPRARSPSGP